MVTCYICRTELDKKRKRDIDTKVCYDCRKKKDLFITKTRAKKEFLLNDDDLTGVFSYQYRTCIHGKAQTITLYLRNELLIKANEKYKNFEKVKKDKVKKNEQRRAETQRRKKIERDIREKHITDLLDEIILEYRIPMDNLDWRNQSFIKYYIEHGFSDESIINKRGDSLGDDHTIMYLLEVATCEDNLVNMLKEYADSTCSIIIRQMELTRKCKEDNIMVTPEIARLFNSWVINGYVNIHYNKEKYHITKINDLIKYVNEHSKDNTKDDIKIKIKMRKKKKKNN